MILAILPILLGITFLIVYFGKEKFGYAVPVSIIISSLIFYFSQILFSTFSVGLYVFALAGVFGCFFAVLLKLGIIKSAHDKNVLGLFFSPGVYAFLIVFFFALIAYGGRHFSSWDECSHWGAMVKEMIRLDRFYIVPEARYMAHQDYPPIIQIFEYVVCRFSGGYSEGKASTGIQLVLLTFVVPPMMEKLGGFKSNITNKRVISNLLLGLLILTMTILLFLWFDVTDVYRTIMNDCVVCAVGLYTVGISLDDDILNNKTKKFFLILALFYLPLCKQIALAFVFLVYLAVILAMIQKKQYKSENKLSNIAYILAIIVVPLLSLKIWSLVIAPYHLGAQFDLSKIRVSEVWKILIGRGNWIQHATYMKYMASLLNEPITGGSLALSYVSLSALAIFLLSAMYFSGGTFFGKVSKIEYIRYSLVFLAGSIGYAFTMFVMYMYGFSEGEMLGLASYSRYMVAYTCLMFLLLLWLLLPKLDANKNRYLLIAAIAVVLLAIVDQKRLTDFAPKLLGNETREFQELAKNLDDHVEFDDTVLLVSDNNNMYYPFLRYYCDDAIVSGNDYWNGVTGEDLAQFDYIYVINSNDFLDMQWGRLLEEPADTIHAGTYAVVYNDGVYRLKPLE